MKPVIFALIAMMCYAVANVVLEQKFSKYNNLTQMICYSSVVLLVALIVRTTSNTLDPSFRFPTGWSLILILGVGLVFAAADYFYIGAYTSGGSLLTVTCITIMFPVFASVIKFAWARELPNVWQVCGCILAITAVVVVTKGAQVK